MSATPVIGPDCPFAVTFFTSYAATRKSESEWSLTTLAQHIAVTTAAEKAKLPWLKLATFGNTRTPVTIGANGKKTGGSLRHDANLLAVTGIEADYDAEQVSFEEAVERITNAGILAMVYTSPSHTEDRQRWRVLCPLSTPASPDVRSKMLGRLNGLFHGIFSTESWTLSQSYYFGSVASNLSHKVEIVDGTPIDEHDDLDEIWTGKPNTAGSATGPRAGKSGPVNEDELLAQIVGGTNYHTTSLRLLGLWARTGVPFMDARRRLIEAMESIPGSDQGPRWRTRRDDIDRSLDFVYGKEAGKRDAAQGAVPGTADRKAGHTRWGDPVDFLADNSMAAPTLGPEHVPDALWPFIVDTAKRMGVDPSSVALAALVSCSSVISDDFELQPKRNDYTWTEQARLWGAIVGEPSILKSPVIAACSKPIVKLEAEARRVHTEQMRKYRADCEAARTAKPPQPFPSRPRLDRFMVENATPEALSEVLRDDEEAKFRAPLSKVLCRHDEMSEFFAGLDRYKAGGKGGSERGSYLRLYNGGPHAVDRIGRGSFFIQNWSATFLGGVQPGPIQRIARDAADDGLLQRFNFAVPSRQEKGVDACPDHDAGVRYGALFPALAAMRPARDMATGFAQTVVLAEGAHEHRERIGELADSMTHMPDTSARLVAAFGKWPGLFARLCLTFHLIEVADQRLHGSIPPPIQVIQAETAERVADYMRDILLPHLLRAEAVMFSTDQTGHARWVAGFILAHGLQQISSRDIVRSYRIFKAPEAQRDLSVVMRALVSVGWLEPEEPTNLAKPVTTWQVNPAVHTLFAARAAEERAWRAEVRDKVAGATSLLRTKRKSAA